MQNKYYLFSSENQSIYHYIEENDDGLKNKQEGYCKIYNNQIKLNYNLYNLSIINDTLILYGQNDTKTRCIKILNSSINYNNWIPQLKIEKIFPALTYKYRYSHVSFGVDEKYIYFNGDNFDESILKSYIYKFNKSTGILEDSMAVDYRDCGITCNNNKFYYYYYFASLYKVFTTNGFNNNFKEFSPYLISDVYSILALPNDSVLIGDSWNNLKIGTPISDYKIYTDYNVKNHPDLVFIGKLNQNILTLSNNYNFFYILNTDSKNTGLKRIQFESDYSLFNFATYKNEVWAYANDNRNNKNVFLKINLD